MQVHESQSVKVKPKNDETVILYMKKLMGTGAIVKRTDKEDLTYKQC